MNESTGKRVVAIVQARMDSTRLPGKALKEVCGKPLLQIELERIKNAELIDEIIVATTDSSSDIPIVNLCAELNILTFRGSKEDVLDRFYQAAKKYEAEVIVRLTADCPLVDSSIIDQVVAFFLEHIPKYDYVSNTETRTFPRGMDVEVFSFDALEKAARLGKKESEREHVTPFMYHNRDLFKVGLVMRGTNTSHHRWTVDTPEDFELIAKILNSIYPENPKFTIEDLLTLAEENPEWEKINKDIKQKEL